jgi:hypothetical protein
VAPTADEIQAMANEEEQAMSQAIEALVATRIGRTINPSAKVKLNRQQEKEKH